MQKVIVINLNGHAYQLDEAAYEALRAYLDRAEAQLAANPDRAEIMADLEQAIADKCQKYLGPHKTVVLSAEVDRIIAEMGPVDTGTDEPAAAGSAAAGQAAGDGPPREKPTPAADARRRLYRIRPGAMLFGICNGLAAFLGIDVTIVRILFLLIILVSHGVGILVYFGLMFVIPEARTDEELAAAYGEPFNAQEVVGRARRERDERRHEWWSGRRARYEARRARRVARRMGDWGEEFRQRMQDAWRPDARHMDYTTQVLTGIMVPVFHVISFGLFVLLVMAILSLFTTGAVFGLPIPAGLPLWAGLLILVILYHVTTSPLRAIYHPVFRPYALYPYGPAPVWGGIIWLAFLGLLLWYGVGHTDEVRAFMQTTLPDAIEGVRDFVQSLGQG